MRSDDSIAGATEQDRRSAGNPPPHTPTTRDKALARAMQEVLRTVQSVNYGSVEIVIQNSRIVQIERKEKFRFDHD